MAMKIRGTRSMRGRMSDRIVPDRHRRDHESERGLSMIELLVATAIFAVALGIAVPNVRNGAFPLWQSNEMLMSDLRRVRADALTKGDHFVFRVTGASSYAEFRMKLNGGVWAVSGPPVISRTLPTPVTFTAGWNAGVGVSFEFNTRGLLVTPGAASSLRFYDSNTQLTNQITVWPSGQVAPI